MIAVILAMISVVKVTITSLINLADLNAVTASNTISTVIKSIATTSKISEEINDKTFIKFSRAVKFTLLYLFCITLLLILFPNSPKPVKHTNLPVKIKTKIY